MENNIKQVKVEQVFSILEAVDRLYEQNYKYRINVGYKLHQLRIELQSIENYTIDRLATVIPKIKDGGELNDTDRMIYTAVMQSLVDVDTYGLSKDDIYCLNSEKNDNVPVVELSVAEKLDVLF